MIVKCSTCQELDSMCIPTVYEVMKKINSLVPFLIHVSANSVIL